MLNLHKKGGVFLNFLYDQKLIEKYFVANQKGENMFLSTSFQKFWNQNLKSLIASFFLLKGFDWNILYKRGSNFSNKYWSHHSLKRFDTSFTSLKYIWNIYCNEYFVFLYVIFFVSNFLCRINEILLLSLWNFIWKGE